MDNITYKTAIIIPAFNEAGKIADVIEQLIALRGEKAWEIIVVNDGSVDDTGEIIDRYKDQITTHHHISNHGYGASLKTGILNTRARDVLFLDADGQHDPENIPHMLELLEEYEFVIGSRRDQSGVPSARKPGKWVLRKVVNFLVNKKIHDVNCGFRGGRRHLYMRMLELLPDGFSFSTTSLVYALSSRYKYCFQEIEGLKREGGPSSVRIVYDGIKTLLLCLRLIMLFDPFRALGYPAIVLTIFGSACQIYIFIYAGWNIVEASILCILSGIILFFFGLLGDQVAAMRKELSSQNSLLLERINEGPNLH